MFELVCGIVLVIWGVWCFIAAFQGRELQAFILPSDEFLPKRILGKYYDLVMNIFTGIICLAFGILLVFT